MPGVPLDKIDALWPIAEKYISIALEDAEDNFSLQDYKDKIDSGEYLLWIGREGTVVVILEVSDYHNGKECDILSIAGDGIKDWIKELGEIEEWAKRAGCNRMYLTGRKGWIKVLKDYDFKSINMVKML